MASHSRSKSREDDRRLSVRTLVIASAASFTAAIVTAQFAPSGTPLAAALTPVLVTLVSELLHRPTEQIAKRVTTDRPAILPEGAGAGPPDIPREGELPERAPAEPGAQREPGAAERAPVSVYGKPRSKRKIAVGVVAVTAFLAFAISAAALTLPELIAGESLGKGDRSTSLFGGNARKKTDEREDQPQSTTPTETITQPQKTTTVTTPEDPKKKQQTTPTQTTPTTPAPQPAPQQPQP